MSSTPTPSCSHASRVDEVGSLISAIKDLITPYIAAADADTPVLPSGHGASVPGSGPRTALLEYHPPTKLRTLLDLPIPSPAAGGRDALLATVRSVLQYSVNTWDQGFLDKLYSSTNAPGVAAEMVLAALNTNVHVYQVSPALTLVEKQTSRALARLAGFAGPRAGGISQPGGSAGNGTSMVVARNTLFPETKTEGLGGRRFVVFTSAHGHYSLEKAGQMYGFGSKAVRGVPVDARGRMRVDELRRMVKESRARGETPFYVNATAGTTVFGSFDPIEEISEVCKEENMWLHVDGSWGGSVLFSDKHKHKLRGLDKADSFVFTPHKMLNVPMTCSFLLVQDMKKLRKAMTLPAGYLFHDPDDEDDSAATTGPEANGAAKAELGKDDDDNFTETYDLGDLTPQCGRRGDSLKFALGWIYYGSEGYEAAIDAAFDTAAYLAEQLSARADFELVSESPPPCLQVCFYYRKEGDADANSRRTEEISRRLVPKGFMTDYAPGESGKFFRVVVNLQTQWGTVDGLLKAIEAVGKVLDG